MKKKTQKAVIIGLIIISLLAFLVLFQVFFYPIIKFQINNDTDGMNAFIREKGLLAPILIAIMEAAQMACVFISVEFLQTATAMSYPWYIAGVICLVGVMLGASLIYFIVNLFKFDSTIFKENTKKVQTMNQENKQHMMYALFVTPLVPFGFICYYGAGQKLGFKKYLFTVLTGVIPDLIISMLVGNSIRFFIINEYPFWILIVSLIIGAILLFILSGMLIQLIKRKKIRNTPDSSVFSILLGVFRVITKNKPKHIIDDEITEEGPYIILSNHPSFYDVYYMTKAVYPIRPSFIMNRYYFKNGIMKWIFNRMGVIPKKLFSPDLETIKKTITQIKLGYSIFMCPEGRLGIDGTNYNVSIETAKYIKQNKLPVMLFRIEGAYLAKPKWRRKQIKSKVRTTLTRFIKKEDVLNLSVEEISNIINESISYNDFDYAKENNIKYKYKKKAEGLENILYYCPKCKKEHTLSTKGNDIWCKECGFKLHINENYWFDDNELGIKNIHHWYEIIKEYEKNNIQKPISLSCSVIVKKFNFSDNNLNEEGEGICYLDNNKFVFEGNLKVGSFTHEMKSLSALAFSSGEEFECYYNNELYYFYPKENRSVCCKWALIVDMLQSK